MRGRGGGLNSAWQFANRAEPVTDLELRNKLCQRIEMRVDRFTLGFSLNHDKLDPLRQQSHP